VAYTLRGRLESRLAAVLLPLVAALALAGALTAWWPAELAALMLGVGLALDVLVYHRIFPYQPAWLALPLGFLELGIVMGLVFAFDIGAPLGPALGLFAGAWAIAQVLGHAVLPRLRLEYGEDGGELGRQGAAVAAVAALMLAGTGGVAWATRPPTVTLAAGVHQGPLLLDREQHLVGQPGAVVRGGILVTADDVVVRGVTVLGGENGIEVDGATGVRLENVRVSGATLDGISVRRGQVTIRNCIVQSTGPHGQGIDISFAFDLPPSVVEGCVLHGGQEGLVSHSAHVRFEDNVVTGTSLRGITVTEMSMGAVEGNHVEDTVGVGIFCGDYSVCEITDNSVRSTRPDERSGDGFRAGFGILAHFGAKATVSGNSVTDSPGGVAGAADAELEAE
jgi:nitrous oxidase accessory protein NosD